MPKLDDNFYKSSGWSEDPESMGSSGDGFEIESPPGLIGGEELDRIESLFKECRKILGSGCDDDSKEDDFDDGPIIEKHTVIGLPPFFDDIEEVVNTMDDVEDALYKPRPFGIVFPPKELKVFMEKLGYTVKVDETDTSYVYRAFLPGEEIPPLDPADDNSDSDHLMDEVFHRLLRKYYYDRLLRMIKPIVDDEIRSRGTGKA